MTEHNTEHYPNPYLAASTLSPGHRQVDATRQFLEEETHRLHERLTKIENDDGSIPDDATEEWSMVKGRLDQTRLSHGLVVQCLLADERRGEADE